MTYDGGHFSHRYEGGADAEQALAFVRSRLGEVLRSIWPRGSPTSIEFCCALEEAEFRVGLWPCALVEMMARAEGAAGRAPRRGAPREEAPCDGSGEGIGAGRASSERRLSHEGRRPSFVSWLSERWARLRLRDA